LKTGTRCTPDTWSGVPSLNWSTSGNFH